jgi:hypothetical protein
MIKKITLLNIFISALLINYSLSCSCIPISVIDDFIQSNVVLEGRVVQVVQETTTRFAVLVRIFNNFKNANATWAIVRTNISSAACGFNFQVGKRYVIFARRAGGVLNVSLCSNTQLTNPTIFNQLVDIVTFNAGKGGVKGGKLVAQIA